MWRQVGACPVLSDPPYGLSTEGKPPNAEHVNEASGTDSVCVYQAAGVQPLLNLHTHIDSGAEGIATSEQQYLTERTAAFEMGGADFTDVPSIGDAAFVWYDQSMWQVWMRARSGNATVVARLRVGRDEAGTWSNTAPLQQQLPNLTPLLRAAVDGLS